MILGVDIGVRKVAVFGHTDVVTMAYAFHSAPAARHTELKHLQFKMMELISGIDEYVALVIEEPPFVNNRRTFMQLAQTTGMLLSLPVAGYMVPVANWKQRTVGKGNASKADVASWLEREFPRHYELCNGDQDLYDAAAIHHYGLGIVLREAVVSSF